MTCLLGFAVGVKVLFSSLMVLQNIFIPLLFLAFWILVYFMSSLQNGEYGAPPGLLHMQSEDKHAQILKQWNSDKDASSAGITSLATRATDHL